MNKFIAIFILFLTSLNIRAQDSLHFVVRLTATNDVSVQMGAGTLTLTGSNLTYSIGFLPFNEWHGAIHGPATPEEVAPVVADLGTVICGVPNPPRTPGGCSFRGAILLSNGQIADLRSDLWYVTINPESDASSEYRGQILLDNDQDGVPDSEDECLGTPVGAMVNANGCSLEQLCPCNGPWKGHGDYVRCVKESTASFVSEGLLAPGQARVLVNDAMRSDCGKIRR